MTGSSYCISNKEMNFLVLLSNLEPRIQSLENVKLHINILYNLAQHVLLCLDSEGKQFVHFIMFVLYYTIIIAQGILVSKINWIKTKFAWLICWKYNMILISFVSYKSFFLHYYSKKVKLYDCRPESNWIKRFLHIIFSV